MDQRLREIERRASFGDPEAQIALLVARNRAGEISWQRLALAAWLEDDLAKQVVGKNGLKASKQPRRWARGLAKNGGEEASARAVAVMYQAMTLGLKDIPAPVGWKRNRRNYPWYNPRDDEFHGSLRVAAVALMDWLESPSAEGAQRVLDQAATYRRDREGRDNGRPAWRANRLPLCYLDDAVLGRAHTVVEPTLTAAITWLAPSPSKWGRNQADQALRKAIVDDLIPWALRREPSGPDQARS